MFQSCLCLGSFAYSVPTPLQINSQGELSIKKMEVQVENFDTQLSMSFKSWRATALKSNSSPLKHDSWKTTFHLGRVTFFGACQTSGVSLGSMRPDWSIPQLVKGLVLNYGNLREMSHRTKKIPSKIPFHFTDWFMGIPLLNFSPLHFKTKN